jgi:small-conductance mechanosensitive channel
MFTNRFIQIITLESALVSAHRKRQFVLSIVLLFALVVFKVFGGPLLISIPYALEVFSVILYTLITNISINVFRILIVSGHRRRRNISTEEHDNFTVGVNAIVNAMTFFAIITFIFIVFQIEVRSFLSSIALFAVALTIIFQDFIKNFLFGLSIMFSNDYEIGDYIQVGSMPKGVIRNVTFSSVQLKTESGDVLYIPNTVVHTNEVVNFSKLKPKRITIEFRLLRHQLGALDAFERELFLYIDTHHPGIFEIDKCRLYVKENSKDDALLSFEAPSKKASLKLKEQVNHTVQKFAVAYLG